MLARTPSKAVVGTLSSKHRDRANPAKKRVPGRIFANRNGDALFLLERTIFVQEMQQFYVKRGENFSQIPPVFGQKSICEKRDK